MILHTSARCITDPPCEWTGTTDKSAEKHWKGICADCGVPMWRGKGSLPLGQQRCQLCRKAKEPRACEICGRVFVPVYWRERRRRQRFCSMRCVGLSQKGRAHPSSRPAIRSSDDSRTRRKDRERDAPGLGRAARAALLARWRRQGRPCAYCPAPATTVDHVTPLVRGGTNWEGNLAPACRRCNGLKAGLLLVEWRTGRRLAPMREALAWERTVRLPRATVTVTIPVQDPTSQKAAS